MGSHAKTILLTERTLKSVFLYSFSFDEIGDDLGVEG